jgi:nucleoside-diphosphate-sugar epimerase
MAILVVGASGATGKHLVQQLLDTGHTVKAVVRPSAKLPEAWNASSKLILVRAEVAEMGIDEMANIIKECRAVASCLGHNLTLKGIIGKPRQLVTNTVQLICDAIIKNSPEKPIRFVLMNTAGNRNRDLKEPISHGERIVIGLLRLLLPPHVDNEKAADYLRVHIGQKNQMVEWVAVRPDSLIDKDEVTDYKVFASTTRSALFNPGKTSRINVGHFMARLITDNSTWKQWKGKMPVIYNNPEKE